MTSQKVNFIQFYDTKGEYGIYSNFYIHKTKQGRKNIQQSIQIDGEEWPTTEHYFQAMKFRHPSSGPRGIEYSNLFKIADKPMKVKMLGTQRKNLRFGKKWKLSLKNDDRLVNDLIDEYQDVKLRKDWDKAKIQVMIKALMHKFSNPELYQKITSLPDNVLLVEHTTRDKIWGDGGDGGTGKIGSNYLGKILTVISHVYKYGSCKYMNPELRKAVRLKNKKTINSNDKSLKILSWNVNGIRSNIVSNKKYKKCSVYNHIDSDSNLGKIVEKYDPDIICLQETKCTESIAGCIKIKGYYQYWNCSKKTGHRSAYSGVTLWTKIKPKKVKYSIPKLNDEEGRIIIADYKNFILINTYVPNAGTNFDYRINEWDPAMYKFLKKLKKKNKNVIWCGDLNVARTPLDIHWGDPLSSSYNKQGLKGTGSNAKAGYTLEERKGIEKILDLGYIDVFRHQYPNSRMYTWWPPRVPIFRSLNKGWRIDYFIVNKSFLSCVKNFINIDDAGLLTKPQGSDHGAILLELDENIV